MAELFRLVNYYNLPRLTEKGGEGFGEHLALKNTWGTELENGDGTESGDTFGSIGKGQLVAK